MNASKGGLAALLLAATFASGCSTTSSPNTGGPEPLPPAPAGKVENQPLPPPAFPQAPVTQPTDTATPAPTPASVPSGGGPIAKSAVLGSWRAGGSDNCQVFLTLTKMGSYSRGGSRGCSGDLQKMRGWDVKGSQVILYDDAGNQLAALGNSGGARYDGQTSSGQAISLSR